MIRTALLVAAGCVALSAEPGSPVVVLREVYLMGTRATLVVHAPRRDAGVTQLERALDALERTEAELSTWRPTSDISALNQHPVGRPWAAKPRLCAMFADVWTWHRSTEGAFDPAIGRLLAAWDIHGNGAIPSAGSLERAMAASGLRLMRFDPDACTVTRLAEVVLDVGAFGKGEGLDRAAAALADLPWMIDLGGQISVGGRAPDEGSWRVAIAHPRAREVAALHVRLTSGSLSTSAGSERDLTVNGIRIAHHLDSRTGRPATFDGSVTVWHERGLIADILSTALYVMGPDAGLRWAEDRGLAACYLIPEGGTLRVAATAAFRTRLSAQE
jgi:thiamine biosynthesis lipoprotein